MQESENFSKGFLVLNSDELINNFSQENLKYFFRNKLPSFRASEEDYEHLFTNSILSNYADIIKLGEAELENSEEIIVITSRTLKNLTNKSGKKQQYDIAKKILKEENKDAAFFIFYDDEDNFRFSFVRTNYAGTKRTFTTFKRYTYFVSRNLTNKTFKSQIEKADFNRLESIQEAFSVEPLNKEFYQNISEAFYKLIGGKVAEKEYQQMLRLPEGDRKDYQNFAVRLIGRVIFVWFLKKKTSDNGMPLIPEDWLTPERVEKADNYYHDYLEKLFFELLNKPKDERPPFLPEGYETIPFLNGGLFEPQKKDFYDSIPSGFSSHINTLYIPNKWFKELFETLKSFNFTIDESSPDDLEVSIDPEMLGTIFENLLAEIDPETQKSARKATGSYYTPREIVDFMVEQSLFEYLKNRTGLEQKVLTNLFQNTDEPLNLSEKDKNLIIDSLDCITILDPACGSGSFLMGALHKIIAILQKVDTEAKIWKEKQLSKIKDAVFREAIKKKLDKSAVDYIRKLGIIQNSLYGVDMQEIAIEIAKLRFFLSLIVDENIEDDTENRGILELPNLEFKLVMANTLIGLKQEKYKQTIDAHIGKIQDFIDELREVKKEYMQSYGEKKEQLKEKFAILQRNIARKAYGKGDYNKKIIQIMDWKPFDNKSVGWFDPKWMFGVDGFDIVIGNPPYGAKIKQDDLRLIKERIKNTNNSNSAALFIDISKNNFLKKEGVLSFIVPKSILYSEKWFSLALSLSQHTVDLVDVEVAFENVLLEQVLFVFNKNDNSDFYNTFKYTDGEFIKKANINKASLLNYKSWLCDLAYKEINIGNKVNSEKYVKMSNISTTTRGLPLQKYLTNKGEIPIVGGKNINRFALNGVKGYVSSSLILKKKKIDKILCKKIISQDLIAHIQHPTPHIKITSAIDNYGNILGLDTVQNTIINNKQYSHQYITSILNSTLMNWYVYKFIYCSAIRTMHFDNYYIGKIPIPKIPKQDQKPFEKLVDIIIAKKEKGEDTKKEEQTIDIMVYKLYGLTYNEVKTIDPAFFLTEKEYEEYEFTL